MLDKDVTGVHSARGLADILVQIRHQLELESETRLCLSAYWSVIDTLSHYYGWQSDAVIAELRAILGQIKAELLDGLSPAARKQTALVLFADHGSIPTPPRNHIFLEDHPRLWRDLLLRPGGDARAAYLYARQQRQEDVLGYLNTHLNEALIAGPAADLLNGGLFGPPPFAGSAMTRLGDVVAILKGEYSMYTQRASDLDLANRLRGSHGSLTADEMLVPWLAMRLDA
jgi:hypothetical protein